MASRISAARGAAVAASLGTVLSCGTPARRADARAADEHTPIRVAHLGRPGGDADGVAALRADFARRNPGYDLDWREDLSGYRAGDAAVVAFVQTGSGAARVERADGATVRCDPELTVGDVVLLRPGESVDADGPLSAVLFTVPEPLPPSLPPFVRPDWDERITDTPGGCAEETGAYRRILLTWLGSVGPYVYRALNCHRVRITDSFAHYHPVDGGFDEFYLVQMVQPGAVLYTSEETESIVEPESVSVESATRLIQRHPLEVGDLVYLPRGTVHRGFGGVLAQIITAPGFKPGAEIGVDHHLRAINERLGLIGDAALPFREASSTRAVIK
ncbi:MAG: hypothetical protein AAGB93_21970 [Planctomycetota bacterium]